MMSPRGMMHGYWSQDNDKIKWWYLTVKGVQTLMKGAMMCIVICQGHGMKGAMMCIVICQGHGMKGDVYSYMPGAWHEGGYDVYSYMPGAWHEGGCVYSYMPGAWHEGGYDVYSYMAWHVSESTWSCWMLHDIVPIYILKLIKSKCQQVW